MNHSPLRIFLAFVGVLAASMLVAAVLSPAIDSIVAPFKVLELHRIFNRAVQILVMVAAAWLVVRYGLADRLLLGYGTPWRKFAQRAAMHLVAGIGLMCLALLPIILLGLREWNPSRVPASMPGVVRMLATGLRIGIMTALVEEAFFRGAMQGTLQRAGALHWALFGVPVLYASIHFFGEAVHVPHDEVDAWSGFLVLAGYFSLFGNPAMIWDSFVALYLVGVLLALVRLRDGHIAGCLGLHAGFVTVIWTFRRVSAPAEGHVTWSFIAGDFNGLLGLWVAALALLACLGVWRWREPR